MTSPDFGQNPYAAPMPGYAPYQPSAVAGRPGWYTFFCVIAIVLGGLGLAGGLMGFVGLFVAESIQKAFQGQPQPGLPQEFIDIQNQMNAEMNALTARHFLISLIVHVLLIGVATGLLIGGIRSLAMSKSGARMLATMFLITSVFEVGRVAFTIYFQMAASQVMQKHFGPLMESARPKGGAAMPPGMSEIMSTSMTIGMGVGICFAVGWLLIKLAIYISGWVYLSKPQVQALLKD